MDLDNKLNNYVLNSLKLDDERKFYEDVDISPIINDLFDGVDLSKLNLIN